MSFIAAESDVRRVWTALRFVDAMSARTIDSPLRVDLPGARLLRNRTALFVVVGRDTPAASLAGFDAYENAFDPVPATATVTLNGSVIDPAGRYLPRRFAMGLPRAAGAEFFEAVTITLDPAPAAPLLPTWAALRLSVTRAGRPAANAAIRVRRPAGTVLGRGMTDARGEALVAVVGVAQVVPGADVLVVEREIATEIVVSFDLRLAPGELVDPDLLAAGATSADLVRLVAPRNLATGRIEVMNLALP